MNENYTDAVLWDIKDEDKESLPTEFLIKRVLVYGGVFAIKSILQTYGQEKVKNVFNSLKNSEVGDKRFNFYKNYLFI